MKKLFFYLLTLPLLLGAVSCVDPDILTVNLSEIILGAEEKSSQNITISSTSAWTLSGGADWLQISATSGISNSSIKLTAKSENNSSSERSTTLTITSKDLSCHVIVRQEPGRVANCTATPNKIVALANGIAFDYSFGSNVNRYAVMLIESKEYNRYTNDEIISKLTEDERDTPEDNYVTSWSNLKPSTEYIVCSIAFDKNGKQGDFVNNKINTKSNRNQAEATISIEGYDDNYWYLSTTTTAYCSSYYMVAYSGTTGNEVLLYSSDAYLAWLIKNQNDSSYPLTPIVQSQAWRVSKAANDIYFHTYTWGLDASDEYAGTISRNGGSISESKSVKHFNMAEEASKTIIKNRHSLNNHFEAIENLNIIN